jgi:hypothetical protein
MSTKREHLQSKNPVAIAPGSDHENAAVGDVQRSTNHERAVRRQLFDDIMNENSGVTGIFPVWRGFLESTWFSR